MITHYIMHFNILRRRRHVLADDLNSLYVHTSGRYRILGALIRVKVCPRNVVPIAHVHRVETLRLLVL